MRVVNLGHESPNQQLKGEVVMKRLRHNVATKTIGLLAAFLILGALSNARAASLIDPGPGSPNGQGASPAITSALTIPAKFSAVGQGTGTDTFGACPDIACNTASCVCLIGSGSLVGVGVGKSSFNYEISLNAVGAVPNGAFGNNIPSAGFLVITLPGKAANTINMAIQGNASDVFNASGFAGFTGSFIAQGGSGPWANARGAGNCSLSLDFAHTGATTVTLSGGLAKK